jgi:hypothetical protein
LAGRFPFASRIALVAHRWLSSIPPALCHPRRWEEVQRFAFFIGHPRSGSSILGSLLDAHPAIVCAHEAHAFLLVHARLGRRQLLHVLADNARRAAAAGRTSGVYHYFVPGQWQGATVRPLVIADKHAEGATLRLASCPFLLDRLRKTAGVPLAAFQIVRNPFDAISTIHAKRDHHPVAQEGLRGAVEHYFGLAETAKGIRARLDPAEILLLRHEDFVAEPEATLRQCCGFLGVDCAPDYLRDCAAIVNPEARRTRLGMPWPDALKTEVQQRLRRFPSLAGYSWDA